MLDSYLLGHRKSVLLANQDLQPEKLNEFTLEDFEKLEENIIERYPQTKIDWDQPIKKIKQKKGADTPT